MLGVRREDVVLTTLRQLGVPDGAVTRVDAGEGGTTDSTLALVTWVRDHPGRVLVIVSPTPARRYRRTLMRVWPDGVPSPRVTVPRDNLFHWTTGGARAGRGGRACSNCRSWRGTT